MINVKSEGNDSMCPTVFGDIFLALSVAIIPPFFSSLLLPDRLAVAVSLSLYGLLLLTSIIWVINTTCGNSCTPKT